MTSPPDDLPWPELGRWLAGEMSPDESEAMEQWVASRPERAAAIAALRAAWDAAGTASEGWDAAVAIRRVREGSASDARVIARLGEPPAVAPRSSRWSIVRPALRAAAVVALVAGGALIATRAGRRTPRVPAPVVSMIEYKTARGQRMALRLTDGTKVTLAPGSVLRRPSNFGERERRLELEGQAYFVVAHDSTRPFTVYTRRVVAHDLGTRFDVRAYPDEPVADVLVAEGKVAVRRSVADSAEQRGRSVATEPPTVLTPGQLARMNALGRITVRSGMDVDRHLAWTDGRLVFRDTPLRDVQRQLERWYDVTVRLASPELGRLRITGSFGDEQATAALEAVARSAGLLLHRTPDGYELSQNPNVRISRS